MPTIRRRDSGTWQAQVRLVGLKPLSRTFQQKADAQRWARQIETQIERGDLAVSAAVLRKTCLASLIERYRDTITIHKRSHVHETALLNALLRQDFTRLSLSALTPRHFADFRDLRSQSVKSSTINHDLTVLNQIYKIARAEWDIPVSNPLAGLRRPKADPGRNRRLPQGDRERLMASTEKCRNKHVVPSMTRLAIAVHYRPKIAAAR